ncbi:MAG: YaiI/YqxD family protein [Pseudomonadota bacterium]|nr:YaiI/YqxD family protein [Pseudomonadota bacterium]
MQSNTASAERQNTALFQIWIDADACPRVLRELIFRASDRHQLPVTFVANQPVGITASRLIRSIQVEQGADRADQEILARMQAGDLVVTQDIPLAAEVIAQGGTALSPRGELYTAENVRARLHLRDYVDALRGAGVQTGGAKPLGERERKAFADALETILVRLKRLNALK